ncbi:arsenate reductase ArsC [Polynucleobacter sp. MWH-Svant-W18]|uniref:arsenate reductase ArsC n=1 Tax=Polynucleobacter sp. MWH-Svant-W18 TaxID=1855909 RepID=UPI001BFCE3FC|nr:arsenate reductase ArsC [Polynucleobacter sp. MWH-Svant-W18]QWD77223.1 arsenate reductase ArsC [Polynucleobacter sp. MWH-Svant-W18]
MKKYKVLFLCHHNSARSIMAQALASMHLSNKFEGFSAGLTPGNSLNPFAVELINELNYQGEELKSKSMDVYSAPDAPKMDFVISLSDKVGGEDAPVWPGSPVTAHWDFPDPALTQCNSNMKIKAAYVSLFNGLQNRIDILAAISFDRLDKIRLQDELNAIHQNLL